MGAPLDEYWIARLHATGSAQSRYLWVLSVVGLFYALLRLEPAAPEPLNVPVVQLAVRKEVLLASGPAVIAFLVLVIAGSIRAFTHAMERLKLPEHPEASLEVLDIHPNAIDLAAYTTSASPGWLKTLLYFGYPLYLSLFVAEAIWLWVGVIAPVGSETPGRIAFAVTGGLCVLPATIWLLGWWVMRFRHGPS